MVTLLNVCPWIPLLGLTVVIVGGDHSRCNIVPPSPTAKTSEEGVHQTLKSQLMVPLDIDLQAVPL